MSKNYYIILGIPQNSSQSDIKAAYRRLAKEFHPDHYGQNNAPFQGLQEAYSVLSDPESRQSYDASLSGTGEKKRFARSESEQHSFEDIIEPLIPEGAPSFFNRQSSKHTFRQFRSGFASLYDEMFEELIPNQPPRKRSRADVTIEISLSPEQARRGGSIRLQVPFQMRCPSCGFSCNSRSYQCRRCHGAGIISAEKPVLISYPSGMRENHLLQLELRLHGAQKIHLNVLCKIR